MSETLATARQNVYYKLNDPGPSRRVDFGLGSPRVDRVILDVAMRLGPRVGMGLVWTASQVTLTAGSLADYTLSAATTQFDRIIAARINATGETLERVSFLEVNGMREGLTSTGSQGDPTAFALWEDATQIVNMRVNTVPIASRTIDFLRSTMPSRTVADATTLPFSDLMLSAVESEAAGVLLDGMPADKAAELRIDKAFAGTLHGDALSAMKQERERLDRLQRKGYAVGFGR